MEPTNVQQWPDPPIPDFVPKEWAEYFESTHEDVLAARKDGEITLVHPVFEKGLFPLQYKNELRRMMEVASSVGPRTVMEIGADKGGSLYHFCLIPSVTRVIGCEIRGTPYADLFEAHFPDIDFCWVKESRSKETLADVGRFLSRSGQEGLIDALFIDGDKCFYTEDFDTYRPYMNDNGVVFLHDVSEGYPKEVFHTLRGRGYRTEYIRDVSEYHEFAARDLPPLTAYEHWLSYWKGTSCGVGVVYLDLNRI